MKSIGILILLLALATPSLGEEVQPVSGQQGRLRADHVRYDPKARVFTADGNVVLALGDVEIRAARVRFDQSPQLMVAEGGVTVTQGGMTVTASQVTYNGRTQEELARGSVRLVQGGSTLTGEVMMANLRTKEAEVTGNIILVRAPEPVQGSEDKALNAVAQQKTTLTASHVVFRWDVHEVRADGGVTFAQPGKMARSRQASYSEADDRAVLEGDVVVEQLSGQWLVAAGAVEPPDERETQEALASKTTLMCDRLVIRLKERGMEAQGRVTVLQEGRSVTGDRATYAAKDERISVIGDVRLHDVDGSWLRADEVVVSLVQGTFDAVGNVETEFPLQQKK